MPALVSRELWDHVQRQLRAGRARAGRPPVQRRAERLEELVWTTLVSLLRQPGVLLARLEAYRTQLGVREVEVLSEVEHLRRQLTTLNSRLARALDLLLDATLPQADLRGRVAALTAERDRVAAQLRAAEGRVHAEASARAREQDLRAWSAEAEARVSRLSEAEREQALRLLLDGVVVDAEQVTLIGVLPGLGGGSSVSRESFASAPSRKGFPHRVAPGAPRYVLTVPWASRR